MAILVLLSHRRLSYKKSVYFYSGKRKFSVYFSEFGYIKVKEAEILVLENENNLNINNLNFVRNKRLCDFQIEALPINISTPAL